MNQYILPNRYETPRQAGLKHLNYNRQTGEHRFLDVASGNVEYYVASKNFAGYALIYKNTHLEFTHSKPTQKA